MSLGLGHTLNVLRQSPHDLAPAAAPIREAPGDEGVVRWVPSRYAVRASTEDGRLILWHTYQGSMIVLRSGLRAAVETLLDQRRGFSARRRGMVKYLSDRGFLVREGADEYRWVQLGFGNQHYRQDRLELILLASEDCNFRCEYCYEDFARGTMEPWVREAVKRWVGKRLGGLRHLSVSWFGGEPLYGLAAIEDLAPFFLAAAADRALAFASSMTTNGYLLTPEVADKLLAWKIDSFQITVDGAPADHDRSRPARDGSGTCGTILENLRAMRRRADPFRVDVRVNFDRQNHRHMGDFLAVIEEELGSDPRFTLRFRPVGRWGGPNDEQLATCGKREGRQIALELREEARRRGLNVRDIREVQGMGSQVCYAARPYNFIVGASGKLMKCTVDLDKQDRNVVGRLLPDGEMELDLDRFSLWTEPAFEQDVNCRKCVVLPICQGTFCPQVRFDTGKSPCTPLRTTFKQELRAMADALGAEEGGRTREGI